MARAKRISSTVQAAEARANALASIDPELDLGMGVKLADYKTRIKALNEKNNAYNTKLSEMDGMLDEIRDEERKLADISVRMLAGVAAKYGKDSIEYEKAGGTRTSERKKAVRKPKTV